MFCQKCGNQIPDGSVNCNFCGAPQQSQPVIPSQPVQPIQPTNPIQPVTPPPTKKKKNTLLISLIAVLSVLVIVAGVLIAFPEIIEGEKTTTTQSEKNKKKEKNTDNPDPESVDEDEAEEATEALEDILDCLYDPESDECIDVITEGQGLENDEDELYYYIFMYTLNYYDYEITDCEKDGDNYVFTVDIDTVDFTSISDDWVDVAEMLEDDEDFVEEWDSMTEIEQFEWFITIIVYVLQNEDGDYNVETETVTTEIEMTCDNNGNWTLADDGNSIFNAVTNNLEEALNDAF